MPPADDEQLCNEMVANFESLRLELPIPPTPEANNPNPIPLGGLPTDVLTEILIRLPAKSLIRFKSVCKEWLALISSDFLCHQHTLRRPRLQPSLVIEALCASLFYFNPARERRIVPYSMCVPDYHILQACNGLMLLGSSADGPKKSYYVYNPTTRRSRKITLTRSDKWSHVAAISLAFDPSESPYYRIVCIRTSSDSGVVEVYESESHTWKLSLASFQIPTSSRGVYYKNSIYWRSGEGYIYYDIAKDEMKMLLHPQGPDSLYVGIDTVVLHFQESNGHLFHYELMFGDEFELVGVWELGGDDRSEWLLKHYHVLHPHPATGSFKPPSYIMRLMEDEEGARSLLICGTGTGTIRAYNFLDMSYDDLVDITSQPFYLLDEYRLCLTAHQFGESLALV